jgi:hypothetical protein
MIGPMSEACRLQREPNVAPGGIEVFARDMTATISADMTLEEVQRRLAEVGQWLPVDGDPSLPVGELVEINSTGPLRLGYGAWRDLLLGCQFINARGKLITAGGRAIKNVAGYDLTKLMVGQQGLLGKIVTITTRTYRKPAARLSVRFGADVRLLNELLPTSCRPQWAMLNAASLVCGYLGDERMIEFVERAIGRFNPLSVSHDDDEIRSFSAGYAAGVVFRAAVSPMRILDFIARSKIGQWSADAAFGVIRGPCDESDLPAIREAAADVGGTLWRERGERVEDLKIDPVQREMLLRLVHA